MPESGWRWSNASRRRQTGAGLRFWLPAHAVGGVVALRSAGIPLGPRRRSGVQRPGARQGGALEFHGYLQAPIRMSLGDRQNAAPGQSATTLHGDPLVAGGAWGWFDHTATVPGPWAQLNLVYGNDVVQRDRDPRRVELERVDERVDVLSGAVASLVQGCVHYVQTVHRAGRDQADGGGLSRTLRRDGAIHDGSLSARLSSAPCSGWASTATLLFPFEYDLDLKLEGGFKGDLNHAPTGLIPEPSNDFASSVQGSTFAGHVHAEPGVPRDRHRPASLHQLVEPRRSQRRFDDPRPRTNEAITRQDGTLKVAGADAVVNGGRFGHLYLGRRQGQWVPHRVDPSLGAGPGLGRAAKISRRASSVRSAAAPVRWFWSARSTR